MLVFVLLLRMCEPTESLLQVICEGEEGKTCSENGWIAPRPISNKTTKTPNFTSKRITGVQNLLSKISLMVKLNENIHLKACYCALYIIDQTLYACGEKLWGVSSNISWTVHLRPEFLLVLNHKDKKVNLPQLICPEMIMEKGQWGSNAK